jgi:hypothetical protein
MNFDLALCGIVRDQTLRLNISANSKQNAKIFLIIYLGPMCDRLAKQNRGSKISWHCLFNLLLRIPSLHIEDYFVKQRVLLRIPSMTIPVNKN